MERIARVGAEIGARSGVGTRVGLGVRPQKKDPQVGAGESLLLVEAFEVPESLSLSGLIGGAFRQRL